jgi:flagellar basal body-associated protein FliL
MTLSGKQVTKYLLLVSFVLTLICGGITIAALRANNQHMAKLRSTLYAADKSGVGVPQALTNLQQYVTAHMNTNLSTGNGSVYPPIQLEYTYQRLVQAQDQAALNADSGLYTAAQAYCQNLIPNYFSGHNRVPCIENYVSTHGSLGSKASNIPAALYEFDFVSPSWSPDLAGWMLLVTILFAVLTLFIAARVVYLRFFDKSEVSNNG